MGEVRYSRPFSVRQPNQTALVAHVLHLQALEIVTVSHGTPRFRSCLLEAVQLLWSLLSPWSLLLPTAHHDGVLARCETKLITGHRNRGQGTHVPPRTTAAYLKAFVFLSPHAGVRFEKISPPPSSSQPRSITKTFLLHLPRCTHSR